MPKNEAERVKVAMVLFERGYTEDRVEAALEYANTLEGALEFLSQTGSSGSAPVKTPKKKRLARDSVAGEATGAAQKHMRVSLTGRGIASPQRRTTELSRHPASPQARTPGSPAGPEGIIFNRERMTCSICCNEAAVSHAVTLSCRHGWYCKTCIGQHTEARLAAGNVDVTCPECREPIQDHNLRKLLKRKVIDRLHERSVKQAIASSSNLFSCPTPNCDMCFEVEHGDVPRLISKCPKCLKSSCLQCGAQPYHEGKSCQEHAASLRKHGVRSADDTFLKWMAKTGTKQCPGCKMAISKQDLETQNTQRSECHKMLCRHCNTKFCFKCLAVLTDSYTCGCSIDAHGFVNPVTGRRLEHLRKTRASTAGRGKPRIGRR